MGPRPLYSCSPLLWPVPGYEAYISSRFVGVVCRNIVYSEYSETNIILFDCNTDYALSTCDL